MKCKVSEKPGNVFRFVLKSSNPRMRTQTYFWFLLLLAGEKWRLEICLCQQAIATLNLTLKSVINTLWIETSLALLLHGIDVKHCCINLGLLYRSWLGIVEGLTDKQRSLFRKKYFKTIYNRVDEIQVLHLLVLIKLDNVIKRTWQSTNENWPPL